MNRSLFIMEQGSVVASESIPVGEALEMLFRGGIGVCLSCVDKAPEEDKQQAKEDMFDLYNTLASSALQFLAEDGDIRPDLTEEAIMKAEEELLDDAVKASDEVS